MAPRFVCAHVRAMEGGVSGESPPSGDRLIKLNTNENPFPPSPKVMAVLRDVEPEMLRRYPSTWCESFREAAAEAFGDGVTSEMILCGNGCDDVLATAARCFVPPGGVLASPAPSYPLYPVLAQLGAATFVGVEWGKNWSLPTEALLESKADAIVIANPNSPSGTIVPAGEIARLAKEFAGAIVIDEAFADFAESNCLSLVKQHENVIVARSFSKSYSLAGLRFGYAVAHVTVIEEMMKAKGAHNVGALAALGAGAALDDREYAATTWEQIKSERSRVLKELESLGWDVVPSHANFILATAPDGRAKEMFTGLKRQGILVQNFEKGPLEDKIRITIGTSQENNALLGGVKELLATEKAA